MNSTRLAYLPYLLIAPSVVFLLLLFAWPLTETALLAFRTDEGAFTTKYLARMVGDLNFGLALRNTLALVAVVVPLQVAMALGMALMLQKLERGRMGFVYIWTVPLGVSDLAAGLAWLTIFTDRGYFNTTLNTLGVVDGPVSWLSYQNPLALFVCVVVAEIWRATAIVLVILLAGVQAIPKEYHEAANVFGARPWQRFTKVTLPLLRPSLQSALILRTVLAFEVFAVVYALAGRDFPVLVGEAYNWQGAYQNNHVAAAYALLILGLSIASTVVILRVLRVNRQALA